MTIVPCSIPGCARKHKAFGLCNLHYERQRRGTPLDAPLKRAPGGACDLSGCEEPNHSFGLCKTHAQQRNRYNVSDAWLHEKYAQGCQICGRMNDLQVDHDHSCCKENLRSCGECVRGLLCGPCNRGMGSFRDNPALLARAIEYLFASSDKLNTDD